MKLYAKVKSERASKGQGGNEYITIQLLDGDKDNQQEVGIIKLTKDKLMLTLSSFWSFASSLKAQEGDKVGAILFTKGNKQKTATCIIKGYCNFHSTQH